MSGLSLFMILSLWISIILLKQIQAHLIIHDLEDNDGIHKDYFDCLIYHILDGTIVYDRSRTYTRRHQIIPYCLRPMNNSIDLSVIGESTPLKFSDLKKTNVTSDLLLEWSSSMTVAENYQIYLNGLNENLSEEIVYNCSNLWFGRRCQYSFLTKKLYSFSEIVKATIIKYPAYGFLQAQIYTCYTLLSCKRGASPACLDWREICNGRVDCLDGNQDEQNCFELELNECEEDEFRCRNGMQCIPRSYLGDDYDSSDCLDRSDELDVFDGGNAPGCGSNPTFSCEERSCRTGFRKDFACGNGECVEENGLCESGRGNIIASAMINGNLNFENKNCYTIMLCLTWRSCLEVCSTVEKCTELLRLFCTGSNIFYPSYPVLYGHVYFVYNKFSEPKSILNIWGTHIDSILLLPDYVCYNESLCGDILPGNTNFIPGSFCRLFDETIGRQYNVSWSVVIENIKKVFYTCSTIHDIGNATHCRHPSFYHCKNSTKCISKHRINDSIDDCYYKDDETLDLYSINPDHRIWLPLVTKTYSLFPSLCDGYLDEIYFQIENETDETDCQWWPCNNIYTRCDYVWNCPNGIDEINCPYLPQCPLNEYPCISPQTYNLTCLSIDQLGDKKVDCIGGSDEPQVCKPFNSKYRTADYQCWNTSTCLWTKNFGFCDNKANCPFNDDELICTKKQNLFSCDKFSNDSMGFLCRISTSKPRHYFLVQNSINSTLEKDIFNPLFLNTNVYRLEIEQEIIAYECNRGIPLVIYRNKTTFDPYCLCPPAYYGEHCEYQSQRVSLTLQINSEFEWKIPFIIIIYLIDKNELIQNYDQIDYLKIRDCDSKFNIYLLYQNRTKNISDSYSLLIHAYDRQTLTYRSSWLFPIKYLFLPVNRLAIQIIIPVGSPGNCQTNCHHGQCIYYVNKNEHFCHCEKGWSGSRCNISLECQCANDSLCIGDQSFPICLCSLGKYGRRCYLSRSICSPNPCKHNGQCIETSEYIDRNNFTCICKEEYTGLTCNERATKITIYFQNIDIPSSILIDFITTRYNEDWPIRLTTFEKIPVEQNFVSFYTSNIIHLVFLQISNNYYLFSSQEHSKTADVINNTISSSERCFYINEILNSTSLSLTFLRRIKLYHLVCEQRQNLKCFFDDTFMCLCNLDHFANCFEFNHSLTYDCQGQKFCQNNAQCFQDKPSCPSKAICICLECFYGTLCQFSNKGFGLSLDAILGYQIRPNIPFYQQFISVKFSLCMICVICSIGLFNSLISIWIFKSKQFQEVGCGLYLFSLSINSFLIILILPVKFLLLFFSQTNLILNRSFLLFICQSNDVLLRMLIIISDWIHALIAIERTFSVYKGMHFNKNQSKLIAKWMMVIIILFSILTSIHDPFHRRLIHDAEDNRTSCIVSYSSNLQIYDSFILLFHFSTPFLLNLLSSLIIIVLVARTRFTAKKQRTYREYLRDQLSQQKHLLISPIFLTLLSLPRLLISLLSGCMKSTRDPWLFLIGYFIAFIPSISTIFVFILPSKTYTEQLILLIKPIRSFICR